MCVSIESVDMQMAFGTKMIDCIMIINRETKIADCKIHQKCETQTK